MTRLQESHGKEEGLRTFRVLRAGGNVAALDQWSSKASGNALRHAARSEGQATRGRVNAL